jgi:myo-inositol-1-phosphate synthase
MNSVKIAIVGVGNCASSLIQGLQYYKDKDNIIGLMHEEICGYKISDIKVVLAYDVDRRKVGASLSRAIFAEPNCTKSIWKEYCFDNDVNNVIVKMGKILDGYSLHLLDYDEKHRIALSKDREPTKEDVIKELKESGCEILLNYLPVGSTKATIFYAECCLEAKVGFINCIPEFIASNSEWAYRFENKGIPLLGDDIKSQLGATITHRVLAQLFKDRGVKLDRTYQFNTAGNTDFLNMLDKGRLKSKKISKTEAVQSVLGDVRLDEEDIHIGPSDYVPFLKDNKIAYIRMEGRLFGDVPMNLELRLSVEDSPNSAGCVIDAIRIAKIGLDRKIGGPILPACAYLMKHPPVQMRDEDARKQLEEFINSDNK